MTEPVIVLDEDQADDLRELVTLTALVREWLDQAARRHPRRARAPASHKFLPRNP